MKKLAIGFLIGTLFTGGTTLYANSLIKSATYNNVNVSFNGKQLSINEDLISVQKEGSESVVNYMPVRDVLEGMGYKVGWNSETNIIEVTDNNAVVATDKEVDLDNINESEWITTSDFMGERTEFKYGCSIGSDGAGVIYRDTLEPIFHSTIGADDNVVRIIKDGRDYKFNIQDLIDIGIDIKK